MPTAGHGDTDLRALAAAAHQVLKDEPAALVERLGAGADAVVRKTYRNLGLRWLQTGLRRSRAEREFANLQAVCARGLPCLQPLAWTAVRQGPFVARSVLVTRLLPAAQPLKAVFAQPLPAVVRHRLLAAMGRLLAALHRGGVLWCTAMPRNFLLRGEPAGADLWLADLPAAVQFGRPLRPAEAMLDLWDAACSPSRRREFSRTDRLRLLCAYTGGDRRAARALFAALQRRRPWRQRLHKNLVMALRTYILPLPRRTAAP